MTASVTFKSYLCTHCGWIYDEADGSRKAGLVPGTRWEDVQEGFVCPECGALKQDFEIME